MNPRFDMQQDPQHLCSTCKYVEKCRRTKSIHNALNEVESDALDNWRIDLNVVYMINECDMYAYDFEREQEIEFEIHFIDEDDESGDEE